TREFLATFTVMTTIEDQSGKKELTLNPGIRWRPPGPVALSLAGRTQWSLEDRQYLAIDTVARTPYYVFGRMHRREVSITLRTDAVLRWEFRPGSTLFLVWQQNRNDDYYDGDLHLGSDFAHTFTATGTNVLAVKVAYWFGL